MIPNDAALLVLAEQVGDTLRENGLKLTSAESCTGGWVGQVMTAVAGSSAWYDSGFVTYSNSSKQRILRVQSETLARYGAVSEQTAREMTQGALSVSQAQIAVSITGIAGPAGGSTEKPVGTVCFAWMLQSDYAAAANSTTHCFSGNREAVRRQAVETALQGILVMLENTAPINLA